MAVTRSLEESQDFPPTPPQAMPPEKEKIMKMRYLAAPLAIAASAAMIGFAPAALADSSVQQNTGNAQITATPGQSAQNAAALQQPFGGNGASLLYHH
jgi:hypothetical protein